ncbi:hypothetical protein V6N12_003680 [Hibiscus sabdariffa]|uniref:Uncharacterized protein n=1 Tax=Hibiscus sabdariffa TaxID=183260 RepID=A0ABR2AMP9_9ROSI
MQNIKKILLDLPCQSIHCREESNIRHCSLEYAKFQEIINMGELKPAMGMTCVQLHYRILELEPGMEPFIQLEEQDLYCSNTIRFLSNLGEHKYGEIKALQQTNQGDDLKVQLHYRAKSPLADSRLACSLPKEICPAILLHYNFIK